MAIIKLDLHDIYNKGNLIELRIREAIEEAIVNKIPCIEIIPGKGSGALKVKVLKILENKELKQRFHRIEKDGKNFGRLWVHFKH